MRQIFRFNFVLALTGLSFGLALELHAQQSPRTGQRAAQQTAPNKPLVQKAPPKGQADDAEAERAAILAEREKERKLNNVLERWEAESSKIKSLHGNQSRSEFDSVFAVERVSEGPFFLETPDKGRIDLKPIKIKPGAFSSRKTKTDPPQPYKLETGKPERWICTGDAILVFNDEEKTYQKEVIPEDQRGRNIVDSPLPFLFGMKAQDAKNRFKLSIVQETEDTVMLLAIPKMAKDQDNYQKAAITLDKKTYLPTQVRMLDQSKLEIVYTFQDVVVNERDVKSRIARIFNLDKDPFHPSLKGYNPVLAPESPAIQPISNRDAGGRDPSRPSGGSAQPSRGTSPTQSRPSAPATGNRPVPGTNRN